MDSIECLDVVVTDKPTDMEINEEATNYMDEDPAVLMLKEEGTHQEPSAIVEATTELKNWAWKGAAHPMEDFVKKIKTAELVTLAKNIVFVPIESISVSISILFKTVCDSFTVDFALFKSIKSVENSFPFNMIFYSAYLLALNVFFFFPLNW